MNKNDLHMRTSQMSDEYNSLREELHHNRKFFFERPLLIAAGVFAAKALFEPQIGFTDIVAILLIFLLYYNLWFTLNRIWSNARIVAYINLVHEGELRDKWVGWERSTFHYRKWCAKHKKDSNKENNPSAIRKELRKRKYPFYDVARFYSPIFNFHMVIGFLAFVLLMSSDPKTTQIKFWASEILTQFRSSLYLISYIAATVAAFINWRPKKIRNIIWAEITIWEKVLQNLEKDSSSL